MTKVKLSKSQSLKGYVKVKSVYARDLLLASNAHHGPQIPDTGILRKFSYRWSSIRMLMGRIVRRLLCRLEGQGREVQISFYTSYEVPCHGKLHVNPLHSGATAGACRVAVSAGLSWKWSQRRWMQVRGGRMQSKIESPPEGEEDRLTVIPNSTYNNDNRN